MEELEGEVVEATGADGGGRGGSYSGGGPSGILGELQPSTEPSTAPNRRIIRYPRSIVRHLITVKAARPK